MKLNFSDFVPREAQVLDMRITPKVSGTSSLATGVKYKKTLVRRNKQGLVQGDGGWDSLRNPAKID